MTISSSNEHPAYDPALWDDVFLEKSEGFSLPRPVCGYRQGRVQPETPVNIVVAGKLIQAHVESVQPHNFRRIFILSSRDTEPDDNAVPVAPQRFSSSSGSSLFSSEHTPDSADGRRIDSIASPLLTRNNSLDSNCH